MTDEVKTCAYCGGEIRGRGERYCSVTCSNKARREEGALKSSGEPTSQVVEQDIKILKQIAPGVIENGGNIFIVNVPVQIHEVRVDAREAPAKQKKAKPLTLEDLGLVHTIEDMSRQMVIRALERTSGNRTQAAQALGISVRTLRTWISNWGGAERLELAGPDAAEEEIEEETAELWDYFGGGDG